MTVTAVGFVPSAPLLVPQVAAGSAGADQGLRDACLEVVARLVASHPDEIAVVATWPPGQVWGDDHTWGFEGFGVPRQPADSRPRVPFPLGIGGWMLDAVGWSGRRTYVGVFGDTGIVDATALLVVGDGTARRTEKAPGHLDERAEAYDAEIARCLATGDVSALGALDVNLAAELMCAGVAVWRWLADGLAGRVVAKAELLAEAAPYGVGYFAASWWVG